MRPETQRGPVRGASADVLDETTAAENSRPAPPTQVRLNLIATYARIPTDPDHLDQRFSVLLRLGDARTAR